MSEEMKFFLFLIERYANQKGRLTGDVFKEWDEKGVTQRIYDGYWQYHQEPIQNAYADIDSLVTTGQHAIYSNRIGAAKGEFDIIGDFDADNAEIADMLTGES